MPEARRGEKPIYLQGDIRRSYVRRGGCDERCTPAEIERFLRDASGKTYDGEVLVEFDSEEFYDPATVLWYRRLLQEQQGRRHADLTDVEFLNEWGFVVEVGDRLAPIRAAVLLFGKARYMRQILARGVVDYQRIDARFDDWSPERRWHDRVVIEENILQAWRILADKYFRLAERPFSIDAATLRRHDDPPDYISFREAAINLLIHQDYGDLTRKPVIKVFADRTVFWNPGDAFATLDQLMEPTEKEVRNPAIVSAFRRIGLSDQAGTGVRAIMRNWRQLGFFPPTIENAKADKTFALTLSKEVLLTEEQHRFEVQLGVHLAEWDAAVFAYVCRTGRISLTDVKATIGGGSRDAHVVIERLIVQNLVRAVEAGLHWELAEHLRGRFGGSDQASDQPGADAGNLVTDQPARHDTKLVTQWITNLTDQQRRVIGLCEVPRSRAELMREFGLTHRTFFQRNYLKPLLDINLIRMTHPEEPNHPDQAYVVTDAGLALLTSWRSSREPADDQ